MADTIVIETPVATVLEVTGLQGPQGVPGASQADVLTTQGDLLYRGASAAARLGIGTAGQILKVNTGGTAPEWGAAPAAGVSSVNGDTGAVSVTPASIDAAEANHDHQPSDIYSDAVKVTATTLSAGEPNGVYFRNGSDNGKATYNSAAGYLIYWDDAEGEWVIGNVSQSHKYFIGSQDTTYPWQVSIAWTLGAQGSGTVPTVAQATLNDYQLNAAQDSVSTRVPKSGNATSTQVVLGSDTRLSDSRTPTAHTHTPSEVGLGNVSNTAQVTSVSGTAPIVSSGGTTPAISISAATTSAAGSMSSADKTKLDGIATAATANSADATLLARANHTGTQAVGTITGLGGAATLNVGTTTGTVAAGDDSRFHTRSHAMTGTSDHTAGNWSVFYSNGSGQVTELGLGASGTILTSAGATSAPTFSAPASGGTKTYAVFAATDNQPPATAFATLDTRGTGIAVLDFDAATDENAVFVGIMPEAASLGSGLIVRLHWMATSATSGNVRWGVQFERSNTDLDADSFDTAVEATAATNGTSGILTTTAITVTTIDGITAGDVFRLKVFRNADDATNDTLTGDAELVACEVRSAA